MISKSLISIIIPVKNAEPYLEECVESTLSQEIENAKFEIILIDDHSTDISFSIAKEFAAKHNNVEAVKNIGTGIIDALQTGLKQSDGEYISRMDADDIMPKRKLQSLVNCLIEEGCDVATGKVKYFRNDGIELGDGYKKYETWLNSVVDNSSFYKEIYRECTVASPNWMMSRKTLIECGGFEGVYPEDYDLVFRWYNAKLHIASTNEITHLWRDHSKRASRNDPNYLDNRFLELKLDWFLKIDFLNELTLILLGAGKKGKFLAKMLISRNMEFAWFTNNESKIGHNIYGQILQNDNEMSLRKTKSQVLVAVASPTEKEEILLRFLNAKLQQGEDYFLFA